MIADIAAASDEFNFESELGELVGRFAQVPGWIFESKCGPDAIALYGFLAYQFGGSPKGIYPGQTYLAENLGISVRSVRRAQVKLQEIGALRVKRRGQGKTNLYKLVWKKPSEVVSD